MGRPCETRPAGKSRPVYEIRVEGQLDPLWEDWFDGFCLANLPDAHDTPPGFIVAIQQRIFAGFMPCGAHRPAPKAKAAVARRQVAEHKLGHHAFIHGVRRQVTVGVSSRSLMTADLLRTTGRFPGS